MMTITIEFLNSLRDGSPASDRYVDEAIAGLVASAAMQQVRATIEAEHPDWPLHEKMKLLSERVSLLRKPEGRT